MKAFLPLLLVMMSPVRPALADPVWDPTEIARLSQQAAQLATNLSATIDTLRAFDTLAAQVGSPGARGSSSPSAPAVFARSSTLTAADGPTASDATSLTSGQALTATQLGQRRRIWQVAFQQAAVDGMALSQVVNQDTGGAVSRSKALADLASGAQDLRGDIQADSAVGLAVLSEVGAVESVLALLLEQQSLVRLKALANNGAGS